MLNKSFAEEVDSQIERYLVIHNIDYVERRGKKWFRCVYPEHTDNNPSMTKIPGKNLLKCFGCGKTLNIIQAFDIFYPGNSKTFEDKVRAIADELGMKIPDDKFNNPVYAEQMRAAYNDFEQIALHGKSTMPASIRDYLYHKQIPYDYTDIGYIADYKAYEMHMRSKYSKELLDHLSLLGQFRFSKNSLIFFLRDESHHVVASASRYCGDDQNAPKYINASNSAIYNKSHMLYGMHTIDKVNTVILVEGYSDALVARAHGLPNTLALCGTQLSGNHMEWIKQHVLKGVVLALDGDDAGQQGMITIAKKYFLSPTALQVAFAVLPQGTDPDDIILKYGPKALFHKVLDRVQITDAILKYEHIDEATRDEMIAKILMHTEQTSARKYLRTYAKIRKIPLMQAAKRMSHIITDILLANKAQYLEMSKHWAEEASNVDKQISQFVNLHYWDTQYSGGDRIVNEDKGSVRK